MGAGDDILRALTENMATYMHRTDALEAKIDRLLAHLGATGNARTGGGGGGSDVASVRDIQGERGDPKIGKMPRNWTGENYEGCTASQCSPDFLDFYAEFLRWKADNPRPGKEKYAEYDRRDAARCRRWAIEIREGRHKQGARSAPAAAPPPDDGGTVWSGGGGYSHDGGLPPPPSDDGMPPPFGDDDTPF